MGTASLLRVGAVTYLNTKPLVWGLAERLPHAEIVFDYPSRLADALAAGKLDVALIPSVEFFQNPLYTIVSDACIGCRGPVWSVKVFSRVPAARIRTLALDEGSRTSAALAKIILAEQFQATPETRPLSVDSSPPENVDAFLLIGDRAIHAPEGDWEFVWDLGDYWNRWTEQPFVFAMWTARPELGHEQRALLDVALSEARDAGLSHLAEIARREAPHNRLPEADCLSYLRDNLYFHLGIRERRGLELFHRYAARHGLAPHHHNQFPLESVVS